MVRSFILIECFFSRKKNVIAYRKFRIKYGTHEITSENTENIRFRYLFKLMCYITPFFGNKSALK